jgi:hypothetical protein
MGPLLTLGIDPGLTGAWAVLDSDGGLLCVEDLPIIRDGRLGWIDSPSLCSRIRDVRAGRPLKAVCERIAPLPQNGRMGAFSQGCTLGSILASLQLVGASIELVAPASWKRALNLSKDKAASLDKARLLFPTADLDRVKDHNRAEALCLAHWAYRRAA